MKKLIVIAMLASTPAFAQDNSAKEFDLKVTGADIAILGDALGMMPYAKAAPLMQKLQAQINIQNNPAPKPEEKKPEEVKKPK